MDLTTLKRQAEEQPLAVIMIAVAALGAVNKTVSTLVAARNSRTWAKEVKRRTKK